MTYVPFLTNSMIIIPGLEKNALSLTFPGCEHSETCFLLSNIIEYTLFCGYI